MRIGTWFAGLLGLALAALGWVLQPARFHYAWLATLATWMGWPLGSLALLLIHRLTGGRWGAALTPALRAGTACLVLLLPALIPVLLGLSIYPWARASGLPNHFYLNTPFFLARIAGYCAIWLTLAWLTLARPAGMQRLPAIGLPLLALSFTFAAIDLTMSLQPDFNSSIYGLIQGTAGVLFALSIAALPAAATAPRETLADIGRLMLALVVLWAYLDFMQLLIVWEANLPNEAAYYLPRLHGSWGLVLAGIALLHFLLPFALLLTPSLRLSRRGIAATAALLIALEILRGWWTVLPPMGNANWIDAACILAFAGISTAVAWQLSRHPAIRHV